MSNEKICNVSDMNEVDEMARNPVATCSRCGAKAHDPANLCAPVMESVNR